MDDEAPNYHCMNAQAREAFRFLVSVVNIQAFDEASQVAADTFLPWDPLEDLMPFFSYTARAYIIETVSWSNGYLSNFQEARDEVAHKYLGELWQDLTGFDVILHEPVPLPDCLPKIFPQNLWKQIVGFVDYDSFDKREVCMNHQRFRTHTHNWVPDGDEYWGVSFELVLPLLYIEDLTSLSSAAAVEALMPNSGSTVVRVTDKTYMKSNSWDSWQVNAVEFESFAALDDTMKIHSRKPFSLDGAPLVLTAEEPPRHSLPPDYHYLALSSDW